MHQAPSVSVILPTYNRAQVLERAIRSVLAQTFRDLELLVVDDGSTDDTRLLVESFCDPRLRYIPLEKQSGAAAARNAGIRASRAPLLAFQDSDDEWLINKLGLQVARMQQAGINTGLVCGSYIALTRSGEAQRVTPDARMCAGDWAADNIYEFSFITPTWLVRRSALDAAGLFDESMPNLEDWELSFRLFQHCRILAVRELLVIKHGSDDSINPRSAARIESLNTIIERHGELWEKHPPSLASLYHELGSLQCNSGALKEGRSSLRLAVLNNSRQWKYRAKWLASCGGPLVYRSLQRVFA